MITQEEAIKLLNELLFAAQKMRSNARESLNDDTGERVLKELMPTLFREENENTYNTAGALKRYADKAEAMGYVEPGDFYNALFIVSREPALELVWALQGDGKVHTLPKPMDAFSKLEVRLPNEGKEEELS